MNKNEEIYNMITKKISFKQVMLNEPMKKHTSFKIGGNADVFVIVNNIKELEEVLKIAKEKKQKLTIIGNGSNILVKDKGIRGITVKINFQNIEIKKEKENIIVTVGAGVKLGLLAQKMLQEELTGFEFASGIPGTIGGAITMNAGAHGGEMKDIVIETKCLDLEKNEVITLSNKEQQFSYRHSIFSNKRFVILETNLNFKKGEKENIKNIMNEYLQVRKEKQPIELPSAGSTFKRGEGYITAKLIDECGLKGYKVGDAQISEKHAGFVVNKGNATAEDVLKLINYTQKVVYEKTGKKIELELEILGE